MILVMVCGLPGILIAACAGDINLDGSVNVLDYAIMRQEIGRNDCFTTPCRCDLNNDGVVNSTDEDSLKSEMGKKDCFADTIEVRERNGSVLRDVFDEAGVPEKEATQLKEELNSSAASDGGLLKENEKSIPQSTRFKDNEDGTVTDPATGLIWTKNANLPGDTLLFHQAIQYIQEMNMGSVPNFGHTDWRLPHCQELQSLIDYTSYTRQGHELPAGHPFENVQPLINPTYPGPVYLWMTDSSRFFSLYCRVVGHNVSSCFGYVWPVRDGT
jgi:hypothetical protein